MFKGANVSNETCNVCGIVPGENLILIKDDSGDFVGYCWDCCVTFIGNPSDMEGVISGKCECGSSKLNFPGHSDWCPKSKEVFK